MISKKQVFAILPLRLTRLPILCVSLSGAVLAGVASNFWISPPAQAQSASVEAFDTSWDTPLDNPLDSPWDTTTPLDNSLDNSDTSWDTPLDNSWDTTLSNPDLIASGASPASSNPSSSTAPEQSEWIQSWVNDLQQTSQQWIQIDLSDQQLTAWEGNTPVFTITVSTGRETDITPTGVFAIQAKYRTARMQGESQGKRYDIPDVPYTMYYSGSYAIHGAYWHSDFGSPVSSGCINVPIEGAAWLYDWAKAGTTVLVQN